jgi:electron-transferring-flavoprotein dehydrogenase
VSVAVAEDRFELLTERGALRVPEFALPPLMRNRGCYVISLGMLCRWLADQATALGVEIFAGMAASAPVFGEAGELTAVVAGEFGRLRDGGEGPTYEPGVEVAGKYVLVAEGARGSLAKQCIARFGLDAASDPQKFGLGLKEIWRLTPDKHRPGRVVHTLGWPLGGNAGGGGFVYHGEAGEAYVGLVVHLDYANPYLDPFKEFQRFKHHPSVAATLAGGERVAYGARAITEGAWQSLPTLTFAGGALLGCAAGMVNVPRIKGIHNAMQSGMAAAEAAFTAVIGGRRGDALDAYEASVRTGPIAADLKPVRNVKPLWSRLGDFGALALGGADMWAAAILRRNLLGSLHHRRSDAEATGRAADFRPIDYPRPDGVLSFDRATSLAYSGVHHSENEPAHLVLADPGLPIARNLPDYAEPAQRYCPAGVYEIVEVEGRKRFQINAQNCVHCKACDIKDPAQNITWTTPEGGSGPNYPNM